MFVQVIEGRTSDPTALRAQLDRWMDELRPSADGYLGTTAGVTDSGEAIAVVRFESAAAAEANAGREEQDRWWSETEATFDGEVTFTDSEDTETLLAGGSDDAGFVQVMQGTADRERVQSLDQRFEQHAASVRPDLIGGLRVWTGPRTFVEVAYFSSEEEARDGESREVPAELAELMAEYGELMADTRYLDLRDPWIY